LKLKKYLSLAEVRADINAGNITLPQLTQYYLDRIEEHKNLNAFIEVFADEAKSRAIEVEQKMKAGNAGKLAGMVISIKDMICYKNHKVSASSKILEGFESIYSSTVVERILAEDAIIIGRVNCDEFAMGASNETSYYGNVHHFDNPSLVPGGSSGGSAVSVQADLCLASLGTDTGGSVRQPASFCGVVGLKPTYGRVSRWGIIAYASSFDQVGPITHSVQDAALLLEVIAGKDEYDSTASSKPVEEYSKDLTLNDKPKIAYLAEAINSDGIDPEVRQMMIEKIDSLIAQGFTVEEVEFPLLKYAVPTYYVLTTAEASSNLSRYDGVHFGYRSKNATDLESTYKLSRSEGFGEEVKRRIMLGTFVLSAGYYDAYYAKAQKVRQLIKEKSEEILSQYDLMILPTAPSTAFEMGAKTKDPVQMYLADIFTVQASLAGLPAISIPGKTHSNKLSMGIQIIGKHFKETDLLKFANFLEQKA
jgi:aspartyl-tRNA(Asn)/glutamyl-tRNA(Gln) amidotransferase subunit A